MATDPDKETAPDPDPVPTNTPRHAPSSHDQETEAGEDRQMKVGMRMVGSAMVFIGFIQVFMSASTGAEITVFPMILYFTGMALWAYSSIEAVTTRYIIISVSLICALAFFHYGEVLFWHKYLIYWGTIGVVVFFMFQNPKKPSN